MRRSWIPGTNCCDWRARIDWDRLDALYGATFVEHLGRPGLPTRLMVGLHLLKQIKGLSDEAVCAAWVENPYFQAFCGETHFQHRLPTDRSSMSVRILTRRLARA